MPTTAEGSDELRIALVMTGGVSLAVWMGGVAHELNRMLHGDGLYGDLLDALAYRPRIDIISGSSAGGLNGALLATAIAHDQDLAQVRELWAEEGSLGRLLRSPFERSPRSLLKGDVGFLPALERAFDDLTKRNCPFPGGRPLRDPSAPIRLTVTTTLLDGEPHVFPDDFGSLLSEPDHRGQFCFARPGPDEFMAGVTAASEKDRDDFSAEGAGSRLALAVRCSASFPFAFEAKYAPGTDEQPGQGVDMRGISRFRRGQYTVDGGVLVNKPIGPALRQVFEEGATTPVRRVLAYVNPLPSGPAATAPAATATAATPGAPTLGDVLAKAVVGVRSVESLAFDLEELRNHNRRVRDRRESRDALARSFGPAPADDLVRVARSLYGAYRTTRLEGSISHILECVVSQAASASSGRVYDLRTLEAALELASREHTPPWVPPPWPADPQGSVAPLPIGEGEEWHWGIFAIEGAAGVVLDVLRRAQRVERRVAPGSSTLGQFRDPVHRAMLQVRAVRDRDKAHWEERASAAFSLLDRLSDPATTAQERALCSQALVSWAVDGFGEWLQAHPDGSDPPRVWLRRGAEIIAGMLAAAAPSVVAVLDAVPGRAPPRLRDEAADLRATLSMLVPPAAPTPESCLRELLALEVVQGALRTPDRVGQEVEVFQISAATPNTLRVAPEPADKLTGAQLFHFGAFYKRSWRYNDWLWGRQDGALRTVQLLFDPSRLAEVLPDAGDGNGEEASSARALRLVRRLAVDNEPDPARRKVLDARWAPDADAVARELSYLDVAEPAPPSSLPTCVRVLARRLQVQVACEEMPALARAVEDDARDRDTRLRPIQPMPPDPPADAVAAFRLSAVGRERIAADVGSNRFMTLTTQAGVVTTSALGAREGGLGVARRVVAPLRGLAIALHGVASGVTGSSPGATAAVVTAFAVAGAALTVVLATGDLAQLPATATLVVVAAVVVCSAMSFRRVGRPVVVSAVLLGIAALAALAAFPSFVDDDDGTRWRQWALTARPFLIGTILIGGLLLLSAASASKPWPAKARGLVGGAMVFALVAVVVGSGTLGVRAAVDRWRDSDANKEVVALLRSRPAGGVPAGVRLGETRLTDEAAAFPGAPPKPGGLVARVDLAVTDDRGGVLHALVFRSGDDAGRFLDDVDAADNGRCSSEGGRARCWSSDGRVVVAASSPAGESAASDLLAFGTELVARR